MSAATDTPLQMAQERVQHRLERIAQASGHGKLAQGRVLRFLAACLGLDRDATTVAGLDLEQCRAAWRATADLTYDEVERWCQTGTKPPERAALAYPRAQEPVYEHRAR